MKCAICKGSGTCYSCKGKGEINYMSDEDEQDYHDNYW